jgi:hypothetical protein
VADEGLHRLELNLNPNEASGLLAVEDEALLAAHGWELAFWAVLDEGEIEDCVAIIGHRRDAEFVREFPDLPRVEGIAIADGGRFFYVTDEDEGVHLRLTRLLADK